MRDITEGHHDPEGSPIKEFKDWVDGLEVDISKVRSPYRERSETCPDGKIIDLEAHR